MNTDTLELEPRTEVATAAATALDLEKLNLTDLALAKFGDWRASVAAVTANLTTLALDLSTQARVDEAKSLRERLINKPRAEARKVSKALRSKFAATGKEVAAAEEQVVQAWDQAETLITPKIDAAQKTLDDQKAEKLRIEAERVAKHQQGIATIRAYLTHCQQPGMTAERIAKGIEVLQAQTYGADWEEFQVPAANAQCEILEAMRQLHAQVLGREQEAARQEQIRRENERQAELNRIEAKRIADEAAEIRRQAAELAAQRAVVAAPAPTPVTAAGFASLTVEQAHVMQEAKAAIEDVTRIRTVPLGLPPERFTDEDPDAATKLPTGEAVEITDPQEGVGLMEVAPQPEPANISLGQIKDWLQMPSGLTREFVEARGIKPTIEGRAILFTATQRREFKAALIKFIEGLPA